MVNPVFGKEFFDRSKELKLICTERKNFALIGLRKAGKTSILLEFQNRMKTKRNLLINYIYISKESSLRTFILKYANNILYSYLRRKGRKIQLVEESSLLFTKLAKEVMKDIPQTVDLLTELLEKLKTKPDRETIAMLFALPEIIPKKTRYHYIIMLDEFQRIKEFPIENILDLFREKIMLQKRVNYILAGSAVGVMHDILESGEAPLFGHFECLIINAFNYDNSREYLLSQLKGITVPEQHLNFLISITGGFPYYLNLFSRDLVRARKKKISFKMIQDVFVNLVYSFDGDIYIHLKENLEESLKVKNLGKYLDILKEVAMGAITVTGIAKKAGYPKEEITRNLRKLIETRYLFKKANQYFIREFILKFWLKYAYPLQEEIELITELEAKKSLFEQKVHELISRYKAEIGKGNEARVRELFSKFDGKTKIYRTRLPKFDSVNAEVINGEEFDIVAKAAKKYWIGEVKDKAVDKAAAAKFIQKLSKLKLPIEKKIFVALFGINADAQKLCKKETILVLSLDDINFLMKRYSMFRILT